MGKKKKGGARVKRATPVREKSNAEKFAVVAEKITKAMAQAKQNKVKPDSPLAQRMQANFAAAQAQAKIEAEKRAEAQPKEKSIDLRLPDSQEITWKQVYVAPNDMPVEQDPLNTTVSKPVVAVWTWFFNNGTLPRVTATYRFDEKKYEVELETRGPVSKGTAEDVKMAAMAMLSASDWGRSWRKVLGADTSTKSWQNWNRTQVPPVEGFQD